MQSVTDSGSNLTHFIKLEQAKHNLTENFEPIVYHNPNPISHPKSHHAKKGYQMKPIENNSSIRMPSQLTSRNCAFIIKVPPIAEKPFNLERNKQEIENIERTEMLKGPG